MEELFRSQILYSQQSDTPPPSYDDSTFDEPINLVKRKEQQEQPANEDFEDDNDSINSIYNYPPSPDSTASEVSSGVQHHGSGLRSRTRADTQAALQLLHLSRSTNVKTTEDEGEESEDDQGIENGEVDELAAVLYYYDNDKNFLTKTKLNFARATAVSNVSVPSSRNASISINPLFTSLPLHSCESTTTTATSFDLTKNGENFYSVFQDNKIEDYCEGGGATNKHSNDSKNNLFNIDEYVNLRTASFPLPISPLSSPLSSPSDSEVSSLFFAPSSRSQSSRYKCGECGKQYATSSNLSRHKQIHRSLNSSNAKQCPVCFKTYVSTPAFSMHILTHNLSHKCGVCGKAFSRLWLLQGHMRSHSGIKPYTCSICEKSFADRSNLRAHIKTHSSFKSFQCRKCKKLFALKSYLNKHYESSCMKG